MMVAFSSFGQTNWTGAVNTDWNNAGNWNNGVPTTGVLTTVLAGAPNDPTISNALTIDFTLQNFSTITMNANVTNASLITNFGSGVMINNALFTNGAGQFINNNGGIINNNQFINDGTIQSNGTGVLENAAGAVFDNSPGAAINNFATITNDGTFNNEGNIANCNVIDNAGIFNNNGPLSQGVNGVFNNLNGGALNNNSSIVNSGQINNNAGGIITNDDFIQNNSNGTINNDGTFTNNSTVDNAGMFINIGTLTNNDLFTNNFGATFNNTSGDVVNSSCATFRQFSANPIVCVSICSFVNNGIVYQIGGAGLINITGGSGVVLNDINQQPSPTASCQDFTLVLDANGLGMITPDDIDNGSAAGYCSIADYQINVNSFTCAEIGPNTVTLTVIDELGFTNFCTATVTVVDITAPVLNNCPLDITINLDAGECAALYSFDDPIAEDACGASIIRIDNTGLNSGDAFPIGTTTIEYQATDGSSNASCSFDIVVQEYPNPITSLTCNGGVVQVSLDQGCEAIVGADDILEGGPYGCYDTYIVDIFYDMDMTMPLPTSPVLTSQDIGDTLFVMITEPNIGNTCWGRIVAKDYLPPQIICEDMTITCLEDSSPNSIGFPASSDNCDNGLFPSFEDEETGGGCADGIITRTWTVEDASGNSATCQQIITIVRPDFSLLIFPPNLDDLEEDALICSDNPNTHPDHTGWPTINGQDITNTCNFSSSYTDQEIQICEGSYDIIRSWVVYDWCDSGNSMSATQTIKVRDVEGPVLICPDNIEISTAQNSCVGSVFLPQPQISDACSNSTTTTIVVSAGQLSNGVLFNLPVGLHMVTYTVTDDCGNPSSCTIMVTVEDLIPPVAICETTHTVALTIDEPTLVPALVFDDGSYDNCSGLTFQVRRMDAPQCPGFDGTPFGDYVPFYCCDVTDVVMVELRVTDAAGNTNSCMVEVLVEDNLNPAIQCPSDKILNCWDDYNDLSLTGEAIASDNCGYELTHIDQGGVDNCGGGIINRIWTATDPGGRTASCVQKIYIVNNAPFYISDTECNNANPNDGVIWPCDYETSNCTANTDPSVTGEPQIFEDGCDLVAMTYEDIELPITEPACLKIIRVWKIHDECQYDPATGYGEWTYNQIIKVLNTEAPTFTSDCDNTSFCSYENDCAEAPVTLTASAMDDCTAAADLNFNYKIDLGNNGTFDISNDGNDASGSYELGTHKIKWIVEDGCGNVNTCEYLFVIADCKNPTPYCINGLAVDLMPNTNSIEVSAEAFDLGSFDNCGIAELRIASPSEGPNQTLPPPPGFNSVVFNCNQVGTQTVDLWVGDIFGNWDYCSTYVIVQDNMADCPDQGDVQIAGNIENEAGEMLESVMIHIDGNAPGIPDAEMTGVDGGYSFPSLPTGYDYTIQPEKDVDPLNGVSTLDLVLMNKHILAIQALNSPYKMIAADVNKSGSISTFDMVLLRRVILQIDETFNSNTSWRFVDADFVFPDPTNPFANPFPEVFETTNLGQNIDGSFIAIKTGDLNGNAITSNFAGGGDDRNMEDPLIFQVEDELLNPGRMYQMDFTAADINSISGYQFTINFDKEKLNFNNIIPGALSGLDLNNFGLSKLNEGVLTTSWNLRNTAESLAPESILFSLVFEATTQVKWSEVISVSSNYTRAEAYTLDSEVLGVELLFNGLSQEVNRFEIYPNQPNPFADETLISFNLPEETPLTFTVQDVSGKVIKLIELNAVAGYNELEVTKQDLNGPGIYFYTIKTKTHRVSKRMVLIKK